MELGSPIENQGSDPKWIQSLKTLVCSTIHHPIVGQFSYPSQWLVQYDFRELFFGVIVARFSTWSIVPRTKDTIPANYGRFAHTGSFPLFECQFGFNQTVHRHCFSSFPFNILRKQVGFLTIVSQRSCCRALPYSKIPVRMRKYTIIGTFGCTSA